MIDVVEKDDTGIDTDGEDSKSYCDLVAAVGEILVPDQRDDQYTLLISLPHVAPGLVITNRISLFILAMISPKFLGVVRILRVEEAEFDPIYGAIRGINMAANAKHDGGGIVDGDQEVGKTGNIQGTHDGWIRRLCQIKHVEGIGISEGHRVGFVLSEHDPRDELVGLSELHCADDVQRFAIVVVVLEDEHLVDDVRFAIGGSKIIRCEAFGDNAELPINVIDPVLVGDGSQNRSVLFRHEFVILNLVSTKGSCFLPNMDLGEFLCDGIGKNEIILGGIRDSLGRWKKLHQRLDIQAATGIKL
mmetsp:Transcript_4719/g.12358  ORF Transcript_4719/g.12358 Transcript_4719/m.12358 type:complete len:303 (-) Transcript_4719:1225-2133(-)